MFTLLCPLIFYSSLVFTDYSFLKAAGLEVQWFEPPKYFSYALNLGTFFIVTVGFFLFSSQTQKYETLLKNAVEDLKSLRKTDAELNVQMSSLISIICHDIANPLNVAMFNVRKLRSMWPEEKPLLKISQANGAILNIVQSVHRLQELRTGRIKIEDCKTNLKDVCLACEEAIQDVLESKNMSLKVEVDPWLVENQVLADQKVLTYSVILNLLNNAIKFSPHGSTVHLQAKKMRILQRSL